PFRNAGFCNAVCFCNGVFRNRLGGFSLGLLIGKLCFPHSSEIVVAATHSRRPCGYRRSAAATARRLAKRALKKNSASVDTPHLAEWLANYFRCYIQARPRGFPSPGSLKEGHARVRPGHDVKLPRIGASPCNTLPITQICP